MRTLAVRAQDKGLGLAWDVHPDVPERLVGDAGRLRQVLLNLIGNAIKFTRQGEVAVSVGVAEVEAPEGEVVRRFAVSDTGIGIPPGGPGADLPRLRARDSSTTRRHDGTGLGLAITSRLVELMGG